MPTLMQQVMALTGGQEIELRADGDGTVTARWHRSYDDAESDERRLTVSGGWDAALAGIVAWEAVADELEAERGEEGIEAGDPEFWRRLNERLPGGRT